MNFSDQEEKLELDRIRTAYTRWLRDVPPDRYALTNPAHLYALQNLENALSELLRLEGISSFAGMRVLDLGCGRGAVLRRLLERGASPSLLTGVDLLPENLMELRRLGPHIQTVCCSGSRLPFAEASFDVVLQFTLFTSILSDALRERVAEEISRVLVPGGRLIWYDFAYNSPRNSNVRGVKLREIKRLFPQFTVVARRVTVAPPLGRILARFGPAVYHSIAQARIFCTHQMCVIQKQSQ